MPTLSTHKTRYIELMKNPLLFLHKIDNSNYDEQSNNWVEKIYWQSIDNDFRGAIPYNEIKGNHFGYALIVAGPVEDNEQQDKPKDKESMLAFPYRVLVNKPLNPSVNLLSRL